MARRTVVVVVVALEVQTELLGTGEWVEPGADGGH